MGSTGSKGTAAAAAPSQAPIATAAAVTAAATTAAAAAVPAPAAAATGVLLSIHDHALLVWCCTGHHMIRTGHASEEIKVKHFDHDKDGSLNLEEIKAIAQHKFEALPEEVRAVIRRFNKDNSGQLEEHELHALHHEVTAAEKGLRYAGYSSALARAFRYLAFTSDFGEALRPVVATRVVNATYAVAFGYCGVDIAWEAYKLHTRGYLTEAGKPMPMAQLLTERTAFQAVASLAAPAIIIHTTVDISKHVFKRIGRFTKWGPSVVGLSVIPLLPLYLDEPVEHAIDNFFHKYGPWAEKSHVKHE